MDKPIKKINFVYLLCTIFIPLMLVSLGLTIGYFFFHDGGTGAVICFLAPPVLGLGKTRPKQGLLLHQLTPRSCGCRHKTCMRSSQTMC